ncbi:SDR family NAD(P)-dependent oxidoreductase [Nocardia sp. X0981]
MRALVTGASAGIGRAMSISLAAEGYSITAVARNARRLEALTAELGAGHDHLAADLGTEDGLRAVAEQVRHGHYTVLVNNAGTADHGDFGAGPTGPALTALDLNCRAVVVLSHAFLSTATAGSALVNVSSVLGAHPAPGLAVYSASKAFVTAFSTALWHEQKTRGVRVLALCPGVTATASQPATDTPSRLVQTPEQVAERARKALVSGTAGPLVHTSTTNRAFTIALRLLPRRAALALLAH